MKVKYSNSSFTLSNPLSFSKINEISAAESFVSLRKEFLKFGQSNIPVRSASSLAKIGLTSFS
jgi:hypothetical protein